MRKVTKKWTQKNGAKIRICDMTDSHLENTIKMLYRVGQKAQLDILLNPPNFNGEMAQHLAGQEYDGICEMGEEEFSEYYIPLLDDLVEEKSRREILKLKQRAAAEEYEDELLDDCVIGGCDRYGSLQN